MSWMRPLGSTGLQVSALGLGTVKLGRDKAVKYPQSFTIPDDRSAAALLAQARDLGINLIDTAPAYGNSEERLGKLLARQRNDWLICSKVGEEFEAGRSCFDFTPEHTRQSVQRSLRRLNTAVIDIMLVHSDGNDLHIIQQMGTLQVLEQLQQEGLIRAFGMSTKTVQGGLAAAAASDVVMLTYNLESQEELPVLDACASLGRGALIKKALASGHLAREYPHPVQASMDLVFAHPATSAAIIGTITPAHLQANVEAVRNILG
ncbi:MAG: aldo/keto reductase [Gammaproteobacteria bacterium]|nr:MAG: aldo/keto reductase [Gammaproteobacteria bacterium]RLA60814.1 MAG: aldo/keto reductase [Gammaproteobacteria bacterium]